MSDETDLGLKWNWSQDQTAPFIEAVGGGVTFHKTEWCDIQPASGASYRWRPVDLAVSRATRLGYTPLLKIRVGSCWASAEGTGGLVDQFEGTKSDPSSVPADLDAYSAYVRTFVERYSAQGVHLYAIENEIDAANFWKGPVAGYKELARRASSAIRATDPAAVILDGGVSSTGLGIAVANSLLEEGSGGEALDFYSAYYDRRQSGGISRFPGAADVNALREILSSDSAVRAREAFAVTRELAREGVIDTYQLHYYETADLVPTIVQWLREELPPGFPIEAWETGVAWPGRDYTPESHADETARLLAGLLAEGVSPALYLPVAFTPAPGKQQVFRGLIEPDGTELPAANAYRTVRDLVSGDWQPLDISGLSGIAADQRDTTRALVWTESLVDRWPLDDDRLLVLGLNGQELSSAERALTHAPVVIETQLSLADLRVLLDQAAN